MKAWLAWCLLCIIWGSTWLFIKLGLEDLPPITFAYFRFLIAFLILFLIMWVRRMRPSCDRKDWALISLTGVLAFALNYGLLFWGERHITSGLASLLQTTAPVFGLVIAHHYLPGEQLRIGKIVSLLLAVLGVGLIFSAQLGTKEQSSLWGSGAIVVGALGLAYANVLVKTYGQNIEPTMLAAGQMFFGLIPLSIIGIALEGNPANLHWTRLAILSLLYLAVIGSVIAFILYYWLVRHMEVTKTMLILLLTPLVSVILGAVVLDEKLSWRLLCGGGCIVLGVGLAIFTQPQSKKVHED
ncbi:MAG TPA: EamA family transporter [Pyrinomonadaceae bacterium]|nr:EamA family transporter [Pyrinomonadaceae bacterium]